MDSKWIPTLMFGSDEEEEDLPTPRVLEQMQIMKDGKDIQEDPKARKDLQKDPPTSCSARKTIRRDSCSHPEIFVRMCVRCGEPVPVEYGMPPEFMQRQGRTPTEDALWVWP